MPHRTNTRPLSNLRRVATGLALAAAGTGLVVLAGGSAPGIGWALVVLAFGLGAAAFSEKEP